MSVPPVIRLDLRPWDDSLGASLTVRDERAKQIGVLRLTLPASTEDPSARRDRATAIAKRVADAVNGDDVHGAAPVHVRHE